MSENEVGCVSFVQICKKKVREVYDFKHTFLKKEKGIEFILHFFMNENLSV